MRTFALGPDHSSQFLSQFCAGCGIVDGIFEFFVEGGLEYGPDLAGEETG